METADRTAIEEAQRKRYYASVEALASWLRDVEGPGAPDVDELLAAAEARLQGGAIRTGSEHSWIFHDPVVLDVSLNVFPALERRPGQGRREWLQLDLSGAVAAVARYEVIHCLAELLAEEVAEDEGIEGEDGALEPAGEGQA